MADLIYKDPNNLNVIMTHRNPKQGLKSAIKQYKIDNNQLTGLKNFTDICKDPLALPAYALPDNAATHSTTQSQREQQKAEIKAKRPDDRELRD